MARKLYAGAAIRRLREKRALTQLALAQRLDVSASYLSQMESNQRPLSATTVLALARVLRVDVSEFSDAESDRLAADLRETLDDPAFRSADIGQREIREVSLNAPQVARALMRFHSAYKKLEERYWGLADTVQLDGSSDASAASPYDEVRDYFHFIGNYVDALDRSAEALFHELLGEGRDALLALTNHLHSRQGFRVAVQSAPPGTQFVSAADHAARTITLNENLPLPTRTFALARHLAHLDHSSLIETAMASVQFSGPSAAAICRAAMVNYWAGALLMPYGRFSLAAREIRHDVELLAAQFGTSLEQVCHRLSTLQRPADEGVPFYFLRVDRAGNITKRHSATRFQFARHGGACPIWNIHEAFEAPDRFLVQVAEMPDRTSYLSVARAITKNGGRFDAPVRRYAIGFGCELSYASELVYSDSIDIRRPSHRVQIGVSCRVCERTDCAQRAMPPLSRQLTIDQDRWNSVPYSIGQ